MLWNQLFAEPRLAGAVRGNLLLSGTAGAGAQQCFMDLTAERCADAPTALLCENLPARALRELTARAEGAGFRVQSFRVGSTGAAVDAFSAFARSDAAARAEFLALLLARRTDPADQVARMQRYLLAAVQSCLLAGLPCTVEGVLALTPGQTMERLEGLPAGAADPDWLEEELRFLGEEATRRCRAEIGTRTSQLRSQGVLACFTGSQPAWTLLSEGCLTVVSASPRAEASPLRLSAAGAAGTDFLPLQNGMLYLLLTLCEQRNERGEGYHLHLERGACLEPALLDAVLRTGEEAACEAPVLLYAESLTQSRKAVGEGLLDRFSGAVVFQTAAAEDANAWSDFCTRRRVPETTLQYGRRRFPFLNEGPRGGAIPRPLGRLEGAAQHTEQRAVYEPDYFQRLRPGCCFVYNVRERRGAKKQL